MHRWCFWCGAIRCARGLYPIRDLSELDEPEGIGCLTLSSPAEGELAAFVCAHGAGVLNAAFSRAFSILQAWSAAKKDGLVLTLVGLGDVGGTALLALKLLGSELAKVQIFDPNRAQCQRYEMELNQVLSADGRTLPEVVICEEQDLFRCDLFAFTASRGVPGLDTKVQDVRMAQYEANRAMVAPTRAWRGRRTLRACSARSPTRSTICPGLSFCRAIRRKPGNLTLRACFLSRCRASASA